MEDEVIRCLNVMIRSINLDRAMVQLVSVLHMMVSCRRVQPRRMLLAVDAAEFLA